MEEQQLEGGGGGGTETNKVETGQHTHNWFRFAFFLNDGSMLIQFIKRYHLPLHTFIPLQIFMI
jgi:hypothetical protein